MDGLDNFYDFFVKQFAEFSIHQSDVSFELIFRRRMDSFIKSIFDYFTSKDNRNYNRAIIKKIEEIYGTEGIKR